MTSKRESRIRCHDYVSRPSNGIHQAPGATGADTKVGQSDRLGENPTYLSVSIATSNIFYPHQTAPLSCVLNPTTLIVQHGVYVH